MDGLGRILIYLGILLVVVGIVFSLAGKIPWLGHMPGDITIQRDRFHFLFSNHDLHRDQRDRVACPLFF